MKMLTMLVFILLSLGCSKDQGDIFNLPSPISPQGIVCKDKLGSGPDINLLPPGVHHQLKGIDGCFRNGECFYNCGKKP